MKRSALVVTVLTMIVAGCGAAPEVTEPDGDLTVRDDIAALRAQFVVQDVTAETLHLTDGDCDALLHLVEAARAVDEIFRVQAWAGNPDF
ncbi:MAG: hypothetical protein AB1Z65_14715, partial [Candidatus Sulfomarinibacteraceae bacterium]